MELEFQEWIKCNHCMRSMKNDHNYKKTKRRHMEYEHADILRFRREKRMKKRAKRQERKARASSSEKSTSALSGSESGRSEPEPVAQIISPPPLPPAPVSETSTVDIAAGPLKPKSRNRSRSSSGYESLPLDALNIHESASVEGEVETIHMQALDSPSEIKENASIPVPVPVTPPNVDMAQTPEPAEATTSSQFYCILCLKTCPDQKAVERHERTHTKPFPCPDCLLDFSEDYKLKQHWADTHLNQLDDSDSTSETAAVPAVTTSIGMSEASIPDSGPAALPTQQQQQRTVIRPDPRLDSQYIKKVTMDGHSSWECYLCERGKLFLNVSQHRSTKRHKDNLDRELRKKSETETPDSPPTVTIINRNSHPQRPQGHEESPPPAITVVGKNTPASSTSKQQRNQFWKPNQKIRSASQDGEDEGRHNFRMLHVGTILSKDFLPNTEKTIRVLMFRDTHRDAGFKCMECGEEFSRRGEDGARNHFSTLHQGKPGKVSKMTCQICQQVFHTMEDWKLDQLAHSNTQSQNLKRAQPQPSDQLGIEIETNTTGLLTPPSSSPEPSPVLPSPIKKLKLRRLSDSQWGNSNWSRAQTPSRDQNTADGQPQPKKKELYVRMPLSQLSSVQRRLARKHLPLQKDFKNLLKHYK